LSEAELATILTKKPWLGTLTGCMIYQPYCSNHGPEHAGYFLDTTDDAATNETRCLHRASEFHVWCGNQRSDRTVAVFLGTSALEVFPPFGCALFQRGCPAVGSGSFEGVFFDEFEDSFMNETRCLRRALEYRMYCHHPESPEAVVATYGPSGLHFLVNRFEISPGRAAHPSLEADQDPQDGAETEAAAIEAAAGAAKEAGGVALNTTVRDLWSVGRNPPSFAGVAVPSALFDLAGDYLDCKSPPLPTLGGQAEAAAYNCNGPQAVLAVEALSLYLKANPTDPDAYYNRGVALYTLNDLNSVGQKLSSPL
jgi:hypothetical protein